MTAAGRAMPLLWQAWLAAVVFVFPIPHTIALRNLLLLAGRLLLLAGWRRAAPLALSRALRPAAWGLAATTAWLALQTFAVAPSPTLALDNLRADWIQPLLAAALAAYAAARLEPRAAIRAVVAALVAHMVWVLGWQLWLLVSTGAIGDGSKGIVPFGERDYQSSLNGFLLAMILAERTVALAAGPNAALFSAGRSWAALAISLVGEAVLRTRNGTVIGALLILVAGVWLARIRPRLLALLLAAGVLGVSSLALDVRWGGLKESLAVGWNSNSLYWLNGNDALRPATVSGIPLEESAYARVAWAKQALHAIGEHPLGLGFGRDAFGRWIEERYGHPGLVSSHSGWLDFALGAGLPGLALLLLSAGLALRCGWRQFRLHDDAAGLMLSFLVGTYTLRCLLDGHLSGWRLGLFAFICGVLVAAMKRPHANQ